MNTVNITKHLRKSKTDRVLTGLIGGIAEYFNVDSSLLRLVWILIVVFTGFFPGVIAYILGAMVVPGGVVHQGMRSN